ncbi:hypothetical protein Ga0080559_TMP2180 [Salipiger profundus]|uniref:Uncharacterized protein n=1 Tax=Salipiger profundus TaxID=1229727 RepID=A0A1U7D4H4_9RHOB|nr:hypothetical protein Ga0080559_TMP2180 [Salipiger profundus]
MRPHVHVVQLGKGHVESRDLENGPEKSSSGSIPERQLAPKRFPSAASSD